ncbi:MAG: DUF1365 domain-containing protein [Gammaproteobacteria bacterium]|nr:DUF1365 domain-containing protein [Gammaproteobacteria bacterium]
MMRKLEDVTNITLANSVSAFYIGKLFHKRNLPKKHSFHYSFYMLALDLDEVESLEKRYWWLSTQHFAPLQLKASDYLSKYINPKNKKSALTEVQQLKERILHLAQTMKEDSHTSEVINRVVMFAQLRCFGIYFSPVNFFFLYQGNDCRYLLVEVRNTPWNKRYSYLVNVKNPIPSRKNFHVSPFMSLDMEYRWRIRISSQSIFIGIENWNKKQLFRAAFSAKRYEINKTNILSILLRWPIITLSTIKNIYWQAILLFLKGIPYIPYQVRSKK